MGPCLTAEARRTPFFRRPLSNVSSLPVAFSPSAAPLPAPISSILPHMISSLGSAIRDFFDFVWLNSPKEMWTRIRKQDVPWLVQFSIYGFCGVMATVVSVGQVVILSKYVIPAYEGMIVNGELITDGLRAKNLLYNNTIAFFTTNVFVYYMNVLLVFKRGRHHPWMEFFYFTLVNFVCFAISQIAGPWLVKHFGIPTNVAIFTNAVVAAFINFLARKFFVFKG
jgi:hypothetical protein